MPLVKDFGKLETSGTATQSGVISCGPHLLDIIIVDGRFNGFTSSLRLA